MPMAEGTDSHCVTACSCTKRGASGVAFSGTLTIAAPFVQAANMSWADRSKVRSTSWISRSSGTTGATAAIPAR
ncbi:hypothetical protein MTDSW087_05899 [Methylobacterium dankookense]|uniref:Uncharacterized protein n=1 Tax=Methylobacterium dankookense TaxID=560405 RepID=A0A564G7W7_9HYPH|nr:hypothetical protein IFDJLNFL_4560 [Methylobacterium dankookense]VUF16142.1 hypothetical protein MTDSW087_05899 [Methylobacterium dankookense]